MALALALSSVACGTSSPRGRAENARSVTSVTSVQTAETSKGSSRVATVDPAEAYAREIRLTSSPGAPAPMGAPEAELADVRDAYAKSVLARIERLDARVGTAVSRANAADALARASVEGNHKNYADLRRSIVRRIEGLDQVSKEEYPAQVKAIDEVVASCEGLVEQMATYVP